MKKYSLSLIPFVFILLCFYPSFISLAGDCGDSVIPTISGNHKLNPAMHNACSGERPVVFSNSDEIEVGGSITLWVDSGDLARPPYTWSTSSSGYSLDKTTTEGDFEEVTLSCAYGSCGINYNVYAVVTVTDSCGMVSKSTIRNTSGKWNNGNQISTIIPRSGYAWNCNCGDYWGYWGCSTDYSITWYNSNRFIGLEGPLSGHLSNVLYLGCTGSVHWVIGTTNTYLSNPCNINAYDCENAPYNWGPWSGTINGESPPFGVGELSDYLLANHCTGNYRYNSGAAFGGHRDCPGDRVGARAVRGYQWVCK